MDSRFLTVTIAVDPSEVAGMTAGQRERVLGKLAEEQLANQLPPRPPKTNGKRTDRWKPYTRETIKSAFQEWARLHDGQAPSKVDWSHGRDPDRRWPRPASDSFRKAVVRMAEEDNISITWTSPCEDKPEEQARLRWHEARHAIERADGRLEAVAGTLGPGEIVYRWDPSEVEVGPDPGSYCRECFHGSGCKPPDMSMWEYAVEIVGGLQLRLGADFHATRSQRDRYGRNRQMVTGGAADVHLTPSDPAASSVIETIDASRH